MSRAPAARIMTIIAFLCVCGTTLGQAPSRPLPPINPSQARLAQTITGLNGPGFALAYHERHGILAVGCESGTIQFWDRDVLLGVRLGGRTPNTLIGHQGPVTALAWSRGPILASAGADQRILLWSLADGKLVRAVPTAGITRALAMSADGKQLAAGTEDHDIQWVEVATGQRGGNLVGHRDWVTALAFSRDGRLLASGSLDGTIGLWEIPANRLRSQMPARAIPSPKGPPAPENAVLALALSPDGKEVAAAGTDSFIHLFNAADGKFVRSLAGHSGSVTSLAYHPSGTVLVSAGKDRSVRLWNPGNGQMLKVLEGHSAWVQAVHFLSGGTQVASTGADQTIRVWDLEKTR